MWTRETWKNRVEPPFFGMVHLWPLPGSPRYGGDLGAVLDAAVRDADALWQGGIRTFMVENYGDIPFFASEVPPWTTATMTRVLQEIRTAFPAAALGVNVLRNDPRSALGIAVATEADFIRVNVHVGAAGTDQGIVEGQAAVTLRLRRELGAEVAILADVRVKHARPLVDRPLVEEAADLRLRGLADALIVTGVATGAVADPEELRCLRESLPDCPLLIGSGLAADNLSKYFPLADGGIVGSSLKTSESGGQPGVCSLRTRAFVEAFEELEQES